MSAAADKTVLGAGAVQPPGSAPPKAEGREASVVHSANSRGHPSVVAAAVVSEAVARTPAPDESLPQDQSVDEVEGAGGFARKAYNLNSFPFLEFEDPAVCRVPALYPVCGLRGGSARLLLLPVSLSVPR